MFQTKVVEKIEKHILCSIAVLFFFRKSGRLWDNVEKYGTAWHTTEANTAHVRTLFKWGYKHTLGYGISIAFALQQRLHERASLLFYMYIDCCKEI